MQINKQTERNRFEITNFHKTDIQRFVADNRKLLLCLTNTHVFVAILAREKNIHSRGKFINGFFFPFSLHDFLF